MKDLQTLLQKKFNFIDQDDEQEKKENQEFFQQLQVEDVSLNPIFTQTMEMSEKNSQVEDSLRERNNKEAKKKNKKLIQLIKMYFHLYEIHSFSFWKTFSPMTGNSEFFESIWIITRRTNWHCPRKNFFDNMIVKDSLRDKYFKYNSNYSSSIKNSDTYENKVILPEEVLKKHPRMAARLLLCFTGIPLKNIEFNEESITIQFKEEEKKEDHLILPDLLTERELDELLNKNLKEAFSNKEFIAVLLNTKINQLKQIGNFTETYEREPFSIWTFRKEKIIKSVPKTQMLEFLNWAKKEEKLNKIKVGEHEWNCLIGEAGVSSEHTKPIVKKYILKYLRNKNFINALKQVLKDKAEEKGVTFSFF